MKMVRSILKWLGALFCLLVLMLIVYSWPDIKEFLDIDGCLDGGGRWDYEIGTCEGSRHPLPGDKDYRAGE